MRFADLAAWRGPLERRLDRSYRDAARSAPEFAEENGALREFTLRGGKRLRALLVLVGYYLAAHRRPDAALPAAAALEHFQSWMLVHDDVIDHAELRRGGPTLHRTFERLHRSRGGRGDASGYGTGTAVTLGDLEEPYTVGELLAVRVAPARRLAALAEYARMTRDTAYGQLLDLRLGSRPVAEVTEAEVLTVHRLKSAVYTVAAPLRLGAILGGGSARLLSDLEAIGIDLGVAFQLRDDVLGAGFDTGSSGKSANDLVEGKRTLLVVHAYAASDAAGRAEFDAVLGHPEADGAAVARLRERLRATGSLEFSEAKIRELSDRAYRRLDRSRSFRAADRALLRELGDRLVRRDR
jgi:geranylgeranyl diphosphate synthase, type I